MKSRIGSTVFELIFLFGFVFEIVFSQSTASISPQERKLANSAVEECRESAPSVFMPVLLTLIVVSLAMLIGFIFWKYYWRIKHGKHLVLVTDVEKGEPEYAFDNPGFKEGTPVMQAKKLADLKSEKVTQNEISNNILLSNGHKPQSAENSIVNKASTDPKANVIPLKSRDFTGLGFNICGNMRDGIYVKDLLHHGPASETGRIKAGDRISAIRINFSHMVYEDAMAILGSASPYEVEIEVEDSSMSPESLKNTSLNNHIAHSFYRSQSFSTAQNIQKIIPRKLNFNGRANFNGSPESAKAAVLEVNQVTDVTDKMTKFGGIKVLPDIKPQSCHVSVSIPTQNLEKQRNATFIDVESDSGIETKTSSSFDEVDLSPAIHHQPVEKSSSLTSTFKDHNMKKVLVKGIQNLKEKINNHIQKSNEKQMQKENCLEMPKVQLDNTKHEGAQEIKTGDTCNRDRANSDCSESERKSKRKAPPPPPNSTSETAGKLESDFNLLNEIESEVNKNNFESKDIDSEVDDEVGSNTIELNSSHITVHHVPEESNRKAASLGDLSKIADNDDSPVPLERAVSLELTDTPRGSGKKRKAPMPPEEAVEENFKEAKVECVHSSKLKKSSMFGTLEEAMKPDVEQFENDALLTSTPMKIIDEPFPTIDSVSNISWELNFELQDESKDDVIVTDEEVPDLPTSPIPDLPTFVTEIKVSDESENDLTNVNTSDLTLFMTAAEISSENNNNYVSETQKLQNDPRKSLTMVNIDDKTVKGEINGTESEESKDSSMDTVKEVSCNGTSTIEENHVNKTDVVEPKMINSSPSKISKFSKENLSDEQILALNNSAITPVTPRYRSNNESSSSSKKKSPASNSKLPKLSQSVSPVRAVGSRIPVRANTEPYLKVSSINKDDILSRTKKFKFSDDTIESGKVGFTSPSSHLPSAVHKTSVLSESRHYGPNR